MAATLTLFEHERLDFPWENRHMITLERLNRSLGVELLRATTHRGRRILKANQYVGVVQLGHTTIQILPKIDYGADKTGSATRNLLFLLEQVGRFPVRQHDIAPLLKRGQNWYEILTRLFATELRKQVRRGLYSHYQTVDDDLPTLKGKWRIQEQLRQPGRDHRFAVTYDEFTADNPLNRVFRYVTEQLWQQTRDYGNRRLLEELRQWLDDIMLPAHLTEKDAPPSLISRLNQRFAPLLNLARLFLGGYTPELAAGSLNSFAYVFDMNQLFESFIISVISRHRAAILPPSLQTCSLHPQTKQLPRYLAQTAVQKRVFRLKPDLALYDGSAFPLLLDTKYKKLKQTNQRLGVTQSDFYQMYAYAHRYGAPNVILLYPQTGPPLQKQFLLEDHKAVITAATVNLHQDLSQPQGRQALIDELQHLMDNGEV